MTYPTEQDPPRAVWPEAPTPFMGQPRAHAALRHELDAIIAEVKPMIERCRAAQPERTWDLYLLPHRVIARLDDVAISFSWVSGRLPTIADGCLLVIEWRNVSSDVRGVVALKSATPMRERTYTAQGASSDEWRWRADGLADQPCSSTGLAAEWMARAGVA